MLGVLTGFVVVGLAILVGYILGRVDLLGEHARFVLSRLNFFVLSPFLLFVVLAAADVRTLFSALLPVSAIAAVVIFAVQALFTGLVWRRGLGDTVVAALSSGMVNSNNIGIPISLYLLGNAAFSAPVILTQLLIFMPISLALLDAATSGAKSLGRIMRQTLRNPMLIGSALGVLVSLSGVELPPIVLDPLTLIANACVPIMLISYGISLHGERVLTVRGRRRDILLATCLKLLAMPAVAWAIGAFVFDLSPRDLFIVVVLASLPTAQNVFAYAQRYDVGETIARDTIFLTTIGCIPVLLLVSLLLDEPLPRRCCVGRGGVGVPWAQARNPEGDDMSDVTPHDDERAAVNGIRIALGLGGVISLIVGILILVWPGKTAFVVTAIIAIYAIAAGLVYAGLGIFSKTKGGWSRIGHIALGVLFIVAGVVAFANLGATTAWLAVFVGILVGIMWIIEGIVSLSTLGDAGSKGWTIFFAIISIIAGIALLFSPLYVARCCGGCWASRSSSWGSSSSSARSPSAAGLRYIEQSEGPWRTSSGPSSLCRPQLDGELPRPPVEHGGEPLSRCRS